MHPDQRRRVVERREAGPSGRPTRGRRRRDGRLDVVTAGRAVSSSAATSAKATARACSVAVNGAVRRSTTWCGPTATESVSCTAPSAVVVRARSASRRAAGPAPRRAGPGRARAGAGRGGTGSGRPPGRARCRRPTVTSAPPASSTSPATSTIPHESGARSTSSSVTPARPGKICRPRMLTPCSPQCRARVASDPGRSAIVVRTRNSTAASWEGDRSGPSSVTGPGSIRAAPVLRV